MADVETQEYTFGMVGGNLSLDFSNTVGNRTGPGEQSEHLESYQDFVRWAEQAEVIKEAEAAQLLTLAGRDSMQAEATLRRAKQLREAIYAVFAAVAENQEPPEAELEQLNREIGQAGQRLRLFKDEEGFVLDWPAAPLTLDLPLWPVAWSASDLLTSSDVGRVRVCAGESCGWIFVDQSRNRSRQWCDMRDCGNKAKAKRHYHRSKSTTEA